MIDLAKKYFQIERYEDLSLLLGMPALSLRGVISSSTSSWWMFSWAPRFATIQAREISLRIGATLSARGNLFFQRRHL